MAEIALAAAHTLFAALEFFSVKEICTIWGYKSQLEDLKKTVETIKNVLADAESKVLTNEAQGYIEELKDAVYDADDLFDEVVTRLEMKELEGSLSKHGEFFRKVRSFFSSKENQVGKAYTMFQKVKKIQKKLKAIADDHQKYKLSVDYKPICMKGEETLSKVDVKDIIGRDNDQRAIVDKLLESSNEDFRFLTIVGVGGLGKTALAQVVYNDQRLKHEFGYSMFWVCVSDQDKKDFDVKAILLKILELVTPYISLENCSLESVQKEFHKNVGGNKYLLVLDDVWIEDKKKWDGLEKLLKLGQGGSRVLVTTRSEMTAGIIGKGWTYRLQGLLPEKSWHLFEMTAFEKEGNQQVFNRKEMVDIGNRIIEKCNNVPLAIKVVGSLLYGQHIDKWRSLEKSALAKIGNGDNEIMSVLKLSYYNLPSSLKSCFSYCALFPKDYVIYKDVVISMWMAQGYIVPFNGGQSVEEAAEEHFSILLRRCFFQDVVKDELDCVFSVKIHDFMHDVAQEVRGGDIQVMINSDANKFGDRTRHALIIDAKCFKCSTCNWDKFRSLITHCNTGIHVDKWRGLRVLTLKIVDEGSSVINSIGNLHHLRYLNLSCSRFEELPSSITKLHNLQTLELWNCSLLRRLPDNFGKLVKLRHLDISRCKSLICMPLGLDKLTKLRVLTRFIVGKKENVREQQCEDELKDLGTLTNLTSCIKIYIGENYRNVEGKKDMSSGGYLSNIPGLNKVSIIIENESVEGELVMEKLLPHPNLKILNLEGYNGKTIPWGGRAGNNWTGSLPNLVHIDITYCWYVEFLPSFSRLPFLKSLKLKDLENLEYIERTCSTSISNPVFFPSLELISIHNLPNLKGWFMGEGSAVADYGLRSKFRFPCLSTLYFLGCHNLMSFLPCPSVKDLKFCTVQTIPQLMKEYIMGKVEQREDTLGDRTSSTSLSSSSSSSSLATLFIDADNKLENLSDYEIVFEMCASSLRSLHILSCKNLTTISGGLKHLTSLESLKITHNENLTFSEDDDDEDMMQWKPLHQNLRSLSFLWLYNTTSLPKGVQYLTCLQKLELGRCEKLNCLPEWIGCLSSLQHLDIGYCEAMKSLPKGIRNLKSLQTLSIIGCNSSLQERCKAPDGDDWPKIQHIPNIIFQDTDPEEFEDSEEFEEFEQFK